VGCTHCIRKVVKPANNTKVSPEVELIMRSSFSKLLFPFAYPLAIYCSFDNKVDNMASTAYAVVCCDVDVRVQVEACNKLAVITARVIAHKAVELLGNFILIKHSAHDSPLSGPSMVSKKVAEGNNNILLFEVGICRRVALALHKNSLRREGYRGGAADEPRWPMSHPTHIRQLQEMRLCNHVQ
jgi:hypothetical protein